MNRVKASLKEIQDNKSWIKDHELERDGIQKLMNEIDGKINERVANPRYYTENRSKIKKLRNAWSVLYDMKNTKISYIHQLVMANKGIRTGMVTDMAMDSIEKKAV